MTIFVDQIAHSSPSRHACIHDLLRRHAEQSPSAVAIGSPGRTHLTYGQLFHQVDAIVKALSALGVGRNDCVATVIPYGPEMAVAFLAITSCATCAPLNPAFRESECDLYLADLKPKALIIQSRLNSPAIAVAERRGIPVITLTPEVQAAAGIFTLPEISIPPLVVRELAHAEDVALVLYTSGTTSKPKRVRLTHNNLLASAHNVRIALSINCSDRCLNVMPLYHIHGLVGAVLSSVAAGGSVIIAPSFGTARFFDWMEEFQPTWYTAVPTIHQAILTEIRNGRATVSHCSLRFIRSSSAPLSVRLMAELEQVFKVPVIEAYGMTEASHQITSNPLPPKERKPGSVGVAIGSTVAIMDPEGSLLSAGETGEIVIRGENLFQGYNHDPLANAAAFTNGWFRTGDQGFLDADGYLFLTGRFKEIINRGGQKISPREVDDVLLEHPAIAEAVTFGIPHRTLGEDIAAAVVLRNEAPINDRDIQEFVASRVVDFKVPRHIVIVEQLPKTSTGKLQRSALAEKLGFTSADMNHRRLHVAPQAPLELHLTQLWESVLGIHPISVIDDFFELGGNSLLATQLLAQIGKRWSKNLSPNLIYSARTIEQMATILRRTSLPRTWPSLAALQPNGCKPPFFWIHGENSNAFLPRYLGPDQPVYGVLHQSRDGKRARYTSVEDIAANYLSEIRSVQPEGPYFLGGFCIGGLIALEMAQQLRKQGQESALLILVDPPNPGMIGTRTIVTPRVSNLVSEDKQFYGRVRRYLRKLALLGPQEKVTYVLDTVKEKCRAGLATVARVGSTAASKFVAAAIKITNKIRAASVNFPKQLAGRIYYLTAIEPIPISLVTFYLEPVYGRAARSYKAQLYPGRVIILNTEDAYWDPRQGFERVAGGGLNVIDINAKHAQVMYWEEQIQSVAQTVKSYLEEAQAAVSAKNARYSSDTGADDVGMASPTTENRINFNRD